MELNKHIKLCKTWNSTNTSNSAKHGTQQTHQALQNMELNKHIKLCKTWNSTNTSSSAKHGTQQTHQALQNMELNKHIKLCKTWNSTNTSSSAKHLFLLRQHTPLQPRYIDEIFHKHNYGTSSPAILRQNYCISLNID